MKGTVVSTWLSSLEKTYGKEVVNTAKKEAGFKDDLIITPLTTIEDDKTKKLIKLVGQQVGKKPGEVWQKLGKENIKTFADWFPSYFSNRTLKNFLMLMDTVHLQLTEMLPGANPPRLRAEEINDHKIKMTYKSKRGMFDYFLGLLKGSSNFFKTPIDISEIERGETDGGEQYLTIHIGFEEKFRDTKKFVFNKVLSLGIFKSISAKIGFTTFVITLLITLTPYFTGGWMISIALALLNAGILTMVGRVLTNPIQEIDSELNNMKRLNLDDQKRLESDDDFESLFNKLREIKDKLKKDILFLKGGTDDMHNFTEDFVELAEDMEEVSENISMVVDEVARGAQAQADQTEDSAYIVKQNIKEIRNLVEEGQNSQAKLETAVENIQNSSDSVVKVNQKINNVRESFAEVNQLGKNLSKKADKIRDIVDKVEDIAGETNILSLNASIEAARTSDSGRGFNVVAERVRELAQESQQTVESIRENLGEFTADVENLSASISEQFGHLEESNKALQKVTKESNDAAQDVKKATGQVVEIVSQLQEETNKIQSVIDNFNDLAAIAEENSASSEEMSASVNNYSDKIKEMLGYIEQLDKLTENFQDNLKDYQV